MIAGVIGRKKFVYDLWGGPVNIASLLKSEAEPGSILISEATFEKLKNHFELFQRSALEVKGIGIINTYEYNQA